ncbi:MAG: class I SAM-dependent rRNA methyltransferase [Gemmatimonadales bacterium]|nr:MAG: class I SAM-dependent rRNA methyltransferase [Gemmatimonadales bacterium]
MTALPRVILRPGREHTTGARHPWLFSGAVDRVEGDPSDGDEVVLIDGEGRAVGRGLWNSRSQIRVRVYSTDPDEALDEDFWRERLVRAIDVRRRIPDLSSSDPVRLVFSEADGLSGLVVDRMGGWLVVQLTSLALHRRLDHLLDVLEEELRPDGIMLRTEKGILEEEGLELGDGILRGREPEGPVPLADGQLRMLADLRTGQKTGFYLDQRWNRRAVAKWAHGRRAADVCTYSGGFALHLALGGAASVVGVDVSASALALAEEHARLNSMEDRLRWVRSDAGKWFDAELEAGRSYDLIVLDPPRFARSRRGVPSALRGYARLNEAAVRILEPGGVLATFSCSGRVTREAFAGVLAEVASRTGRRLRILETLGQPADHPVDPNTPETAYLKGFVLEV